MIWLNNEQSGFWIHMFSILIGLKMFEMMCDGFAKKHEKNMKRIREAVEGKS